MALGGLRTPLSQQLAVLRRAGLVVTRKEGSTVYCFLTSPHGAEPPAVARTILTTVHSGRVELLEDLRTPEPPATERRSRSREGRRSPDHTTSTAAPLTRSAARSASAVSARSRG